MALRSVVKYCYRVSERADRRGMTATAEMIREELWLHSWTPVDTRIFIGCDIAMASNPDGTLEQLLPLIAEWSHLTDLEIKAHPRTREMLDYSKRLNKCERTEEK